MTDFAHLQQETEPLRSANAVLCSPVLSEPAAEQTRRAMLAALAAGERKSMFARVLGASIPVALVASMLVYLAWAVRTSISLVQ
jgi:hypothetical protein